MGCNRPPWYNPAAMGSSRRLADRRGGVVLLWQHTHVPHAFRRKFIGERWVCCAQVPGDGVAGDDGRSTARSRRVLAVKEDVVRLELALRHLVVEWNLLGRRRLVSSEYARRHLGVWG